jgi:HlyD family secretion protein
VVAAAALAVGVPAILSTQNKSNAQSIYQTSPALKGNLTAVVGATGTVRSNQSASLVWQTSGRVGKISVTKGMEVTEKEILAELDQTSLSQSMILAQADLVSAQQNLDKVINNSEARADAAYNLNQAQKDLETAEKNTRSKQYQRADQNTIDIAQANLLLAKKDLERAEQAYDRNKGNTEEQYANALSQLASARQTFQNKQYNYDYVQGLPSALDIEEVNAKLEQAKAKLQSAKTEWERIKDGPSPDDVEAAEAKVAAAQATLAMVKMTSPFSGTVTDVFNKPGDIVTAGTNGFQVDDLSRLLIDVQVSEIDINQTAIGQTVTLTFDAVPGKEYNGTVVDIASTGTNSGGSVNFTVTVEVTDTDQDVKPGMTAAVNITVKQLENVLLIPNRAVQLKDGKRIVYVLKNNAAIPVEVTLGSSANANSQVLKGDLLAGDAIILNPPAQTTGPGGGGPGGQ